MSKYFILSSLGKSIYLSIYTFPLPYIRLSSKFIPFLARQICLIKDISLLYYCKTFLPIIKRYGHIFSEFYVNTYSKHNNFQPNCIGNIILAKNNGS